MLKLASSFDSGGGSFLRETKLPLSQPTLRRATLFFKHRISGYLVPVAAVGIFGTTQRQRRALTDVSATYVTHLHMSH